MRAYRRGLVVDRSACSLQSARKEWSCFLQKGLNLDLAEFDQNRSQRKGADSTKEVEVLLNLTALTNIDPRHTSLPHRSKAHNTPTQIQDAQHSDKEGETQQSKFDAEQR